LITVQVLEFEEVVDILPDEVEGAKVDETGAACGALS
jgi:hypothetical protein